MKLSNLNACVIWCHLRLSKKFGSTKTEMDKSYKAFASFVTELKLEHDSGKKESDRLTQLPVSTWEHPKEDAGPYSHMQPTI